MNLKIFASLIIASLFTLGTLRAQETQPCDPKAYIPFNLTPGHTSVYGEEIPVTPDSFPPPPTGGESGYRGIYYVHGLGGDKSSWSSVAQAVDEGNATANFPAYKTKGITLAQYNDGSLAQAAHDINNQMPSYDATMNAAGITDFSKNFIISHSQGGLVSRMADYSLEQYPESFRRFYGVVTFGSPHGGAQILNSRDQTNLVQEMISDMCTGFLTNSAYQIISKSPIIKSFFFDDITNTLGDICDLSPGVLPLAVGGLYAGTTADYPVGGAVLEDLNAYGNPNVHKAAFYGAEYTQDDDDSANPKQLMWRTFSSFMGPTGTAPVFTYNDDSKLVDTANVISSELEIAYVEKALEVAMLEGMGMPCNTLKWVLNPVYCSVYDPMYWNALNSRNTLFNARNKWNSLDDQWKVIIGAAQYVPTGNGGECFCNSYNGYEGWTMDTWFQTSDPDECINYIDPDPNVSTYCSYLPEMQWVHKESDGVVTVESQSAFPGVAWTNRMPYNNHLQERNSTQTKDALEKLLGGNAGDPWFKTDTK